MVISVWESRTCFPIFRHQDLLLELSRQYHSCKNAEENAARGKKLKTQTGKVLIGNTLAGSSIDLGGKTSDAAMYKSRTEAAEALGRLTYYGDEKRRILSIVTYLFPYRVLMEYFACAKATVTAARVHAKLFGCGGVPPTSVKFTRQKVSGDVLDSFSEFIHGDGISRASSCRSVLVNKVETPIRYW